MTHRWSLVSQRMATAQTVRNEDVNRRSSGLRHWLLVPTAGLLMYAGIVWIAILVLSPLVRLRRIFERKT